MDTIEFANGLTLNCPYLSTIPRQKMAFVAVSGISFSAAANLFINPDNTKTIKYGDWILHDYTELNYLMQESYGIKACLTGGYDERSGLE